MLIIQEVYMYQEVFHFGYNILPDLNEIAKSACYDYVNFGKIFIKLMTKSNTRKLIYSFVVVWHTWHWDCTSSHAKGGTSRVHDVDHLAPDCTQD